MTQVGIRKEKRSETLEQEISKICVSCGMCCDGTLFAHANVRDESDRAMADALGLSTGSEGDNLWFLLPCHHFESECTVYDQNRPLICGSYFCDPIRKLKRKDASLQEVQAKIAQAMRIKQQFEHAMEAYPEFSAKTVFQVRQKLYFQDLSRSEQADMRGRYAMLYLLGYKLFPLLVKIAGRGKKAGKKREKKAQTAS